MSPGTINIENNVIEVTDLVIDDPRDVSTIKAAIEAIDADITKVFVDCTVVGARAFVGLASGNEVQHLREVLETSRVEAKKIAESICESLVKTSEATKEKLQEELAELQRSFEELVHDGATLEEFRALLDPNVEGSAGQTLLHRMSRQARELTGDVVEDAKRAHEEQTKAQQELLEKLQKAVEGVASWVARQEESLRGTQVGHDFSAGIDEVLGEMVRHIEGATVEDVTCETGHVPGSKVGDHVVEVDGIRVVTEEKFEKKAMTVGRARKLGEEACKNREASAAIIVVASMDHVPGGQPFAIVDSTLAIVDGSVPYTLQLIVRYMLQVAKMRANGSAEGDITVLTDHVGELLERMSSRLKNLTTMRAGVSKSQAGLQGITTAMDKLESELKADLAELGVLLADATGGDETALAA